MVGEASSQVANAQFTSEEHYSAVRERIGKWGAEFSMESVLWAEESL